MSSEIRSRSRSLSGRASANEALGRTPVIARMDLTVPCRPRSQLEPEIADDRGRRLAISTPAFPNESPNPSCEARPSPRIADGVLRHMVFDVEQNGTPYAGACIADHDHFRIGGVPTFCPHFVVRDRHSTSSSMTITPGQRPSGSSDQHVDTPSGGGCAGSNPAGGTGALQQVRGPIRESWVGPPCYAPKCRTRSSTLRGGEPRSIARQARTLGRLP